MTRWRDIDGYPNYEVSDLGDIQNKKTGKYLIPINRGRYLAVNLCNKGKMKTLNINRLVLLSFREQPSPKHNHAAHYDGNPYNNRLDNLRWATCQENTDDRRRHGRIARGSSQGLSKLTEEDVISIRKSSAVAAELAKAYGVCIKTIYRVKQRRTWEWLP